jgi:CheY-like chemotaxis protein
LEESPVVLVIEDDPPIQIIIEDALTDGGFKPAIAASGEEAVTLLKGGQTKIPGTCHRHQSARQDGWLASRQAGQTD